MIIDLTQEISTNMCVYPGTEQPILKRICTIEKDGFMETELTMYSHTGTHIDSPGHVFKGGKKLEEFYIDSFAGTGLVINCSELEYDSKITLKHIERYMEEISQVEFILFFTGWDEYWNTDKYFEGFPTLSKSAANKLSKMENLKGIGIDAISFEPIDSEYLPIHKILLARNDIILIENLTNLKSVLGRKFEIYIFPLKFINSDGSPVRAVASFFEDSCF